MREPIDIPRYQLDLGIMGRPELIINLDKDHAPRPRVIFGNSDRYLTVNGVKIKGTATMVRVSSTSDTFRVGESRDSCEGMPYRADGNGVISFAGWEKLKTVLAAAVNAWIKGHRRDYLHSQALQLRKSAVDCEHLIAQHNAEIADLRVKCAKLDEQADALDAAAKASAT